MPDLVEGRFRLLTAFVAHDDQHDAQLFARRIDEAKRRARRFELFDRIVEGDAR